MRYLWDHKAELAASIAGSHAWVAVPRATVVCIFVYNRLSTVVFYFIFVRSITSTWNRRDATVRIYYDATNFVTRVPDLPLVLPILSPPCHVAFVSFDAKKGLLPTLLSIHRISNVTSRCISISVLAYLY